MSLHVLPVGDTVEHAPAYDCICGPRREVVEHEGSLRWAVVHHGSNTERPEMSVTSETIGA